MGGDKRRMKGGPTAAGRAVLLALATTGRLPPGGRGCWNVVHRLVKDGHATYQAVPGTTASRFVITDRGRLAIGERLTPDPQPYEERPCSTG